MLVVGALLALAGAGRTAAAGDARLRIGIDVMNLGTGLPISQGAVLHQETSFQVTVRTNGADCAGQYVVTALGAPGNPPSVLVQAVPFIIGPAIGNDSASGQPLTTGVSNDWKISASRNGAGRRQFSVALFEFSVRPMPPSAPPGPLSPPVSPPARSGPSLPVERTGSDDVLYPGGGVSYYPKAQSSRFEEGVRVISVSLHMKQASVDPWKLRILDGLPVGGGSRSLLDAADVNRKTVASMEVPNSPAGWLTFLLGPVSLEAGKTYYLFIDGHDLSGGPDAIWSQSAPGRQPGPYADGEVWICVYDWSNNSNVLPEVADAYFDYASRIYFAREIKGK